MLREPRLLLNTNSDPASLAPARRAVENFCTEQNLDEIGTAELGLCVNEAMANIYRHAYNERADQPIELTTTRRADGIEVRLRDWGTGKHPGTLPECKVDLLKPGGLGLICLQQYMDDVRFIPQSDGMMLVLFRKYRTMSSESA